MPTLTGSLWFTNYHPRQVENELIFVFGFKYSVSKHDILTSFKKVPFGFFFSLADQNRVEIVRQDRET